MGDIQDILKNEKNNDRQICLYRVNKYWLAFERSAFNLFSVCNVDTVFKVKGVKKEDTMLVAVFKDDVHDMSNPQLKILEKSDTKMLIGCQIKCRGFQYWKESQPLLTINANSEDEEYTIFDFSV